MPGRIFRDDDYPADSLFSPRPVNANVLTVRTGGPDTTHFAAKAAYPKTGTQRRRVYDAIRNSEYGLTNDDIVVQLDMLIQSVCPAVNSLAKDGWIFDTGNRRETRTGHQAIVWATR